MSNEVTRRALSAGLGIGALALLAPRAKADTPFSSFSFPATGAPAARTMPDRLAEVKNVKDFGAVGNGQNDDTAAIQAAVNRTDAPYSSTNRGTIYFPVGRYKVSSPITFEEADINIAFIGEPGAVLQGTMNDFVLKRTAGSPGPTGGVHRIENLWINGSHGISLNRCVGAKIVNCAVRVGGVGIATYNSQSITIDACSIMGAAVGVLAGNSTMIHNTDITGCNEGVRHSNLGLTVHGGRYEVNNTAIRIGVDENGSSFQSTGVHIAGLSMESNNTAIHLQSASAVKIDACAVSNNVPGKTHGIFIEGGENVVVSGVVVSSVHPFARAGITVQGNGRIVFMGVRCNTPGTRWSVAAGTSTFIASDN